ncbi:MAG: AraC family transcriptional regulator [Spirochaetota bacterium]
MRIVEIGFGSVLAGMETRPHAHSDACEFHYFMSGEGRFITRGESFDANRGRIFFSLPGDRHDTVLAGTRKVSLFYLRFHPSAEDDALIRRVRQRVPLKGLFIGVDHRHLFDEMIWRHESGEEDMREAARHELIAFCYSLAAKADTPHAERASPHVRAAIAYMQENVTSSLTLASIASHVRVNPSYLARLFRKATGFPPITYFMKMKIETAQYLLRETNRPVTSIASELSFCNPYHFSSTFKRHAGMSPRAYRTERHAV